MALGAFVASCGEKKEEKKDGFEVSRTKTEEKKEEKSEGVPIDMDNKGVGPIKNLDFPSDIDPEMPHVEKPNSMPSALLAIWWTNA